MARKSRRNKEEIQIRERLPEILRERRIKVAGYVRISNDNTETDSVETQMLLIRQFLENHMEMELYDFYCDIGYTGTNFERPEFTRMMDDIRAGKAECIIVKDFSRFGRNYIETGYYLENILPHLGVRFIAVNESFDSDRQEDRDSITLPIKNLVNSMYAADVSKKIIKSIELHHELGNAKYRTTVYGYFLNRETNKLEVDPVSSKYVKIIFWWYLHGYSCHEIADRLNLLEVPIPSKYKEQFTNRKSSSKNSSWSNSAVCFILRNQVYIGNKVNGRIRTRLLENQDHVKIEEDKWYIHEGTHEAIICKEDFEKVNEQLNAHKARYRRIMEQAVQQHTYYQNLFSKKVVCAECGATMTYVRKNKGDGKWGLQTAYYTCSREKQAPCRQIVYEDRLKMIVLEQLKNIFIYVCGQKSLIQSLRDGTNEKSVLRSYEKKLVNLKRKQQDVEALILSIYKDLAEKVINEEEYQLLNARYMKEKRALQEQIERLDEVVFKMRRWIDSFENLGEQFSCFLSDNVSSQAIIEETVSKVIVSADGSAELVLNCEDVIARFRSLLEDEHEENSNVLKAVFA